MRKIVLFLFVFLLSIGTTLLTQVARIVIADTQNDTEQSCKLPVGDAEERSEEDKDASEEENDETFSFNHRWSSRELSVTLSTHACYQSILFKNIERKVVIPPPKA